MSVTFVQVHTLSPTSAAVKYHSMGVYLQVQQWLEVDCEMNPEDWRWIFSKTACIQTKQISCQLQKLCFTVSDATAKQTVTPGSAVVRSMDCHVQLPVETAEV